MIAVDGGGTKTETVLFTKDGTVCRRLFDGASNPNIVGMPAAEAVLKRAVDRCLSAAPSVTALFAGIAGAGNEGNRRQLKDYLKAAYPDIISDVDSDIQNVLHLIPEEKRVAVILGTGASVFGYDGMVLKKAGGYGFLFDRTGGFAIGREALVHAFRAEEGLDEESGLSAEVVRKLGTAAVSRIPSLLRASPDEIAAFAPLCLQAAREKDPYASRILNDSMSVLCEQIRHVRASGDFGDAVVISGGLTAYEDLLRPILISALGDSCRLFFSPHPPVYGAAVKAMALSGEAVTATFTDNFERTLTMT